MNSAKLNTGLSFTWLEMEIVVVPSQFSPMKAKYKAQALEYFRRHAKLQNADRVFHLDEETEIDAFAVRTTLDLIEKTRLAIGIVRSQRFRVLRN